jgi:hypothetical protein
MLGGIRNSGESVQKFIERVKKKEEGVKLMGFGHRVYKNGDHRAGILMGLGKKMAGTLTGTFGGLPALIARASANAATVDEFVAARPWIANLAADPATASTTSVCLRFTDPRITDGAAFARAVVKRLEQAGAALDVGAYRDAPPGLRIWCGSTVEQSDVAALMPWIDWAFHAGIADLATAA